MGIQFQLYDINKLHFKDKSWLWWYTMSALRQTTGQQFFFYKLGAIGYKVCSGQKPSTHPPILDKYVLIQDKWNSKMSRIYSVHA